jgi:glucans biosynthesis protein
VDDNTNANGNGGTPAGPERDPIETPPPHEAAGPPNGWKAECGAKTRSGGTCRLPPVAGRTRCRLHGGASLAGVAHPGFKTGKRSRYLKELPKELKRGYRAALADPELAGLGEELALLEVRISGLLRRLSEEQPPPWGEAAESLNDLAAAVAEGDLDAIREVLALHAQVVRTGADAAKAQAGTWRLLMEAVNQKTKTAAAESRRLAEDAATVRVDAAMALVQSVLYAARDVIPDHAVLAQLQQRLLVLLPPE